MQTVFWSTVHRTVPKPKSHIRRPLKGASVHRASLPFTTPMGRHIDCLLPDEKFLGACTGGFAQIYVDSIMLREVFTRFFLGPEIVVEQLWKLWSISASLLTIATLIYGFSSRSYIQYEKTASSWQQDWNCSPFLWRKLY